MGTILSGNKKVAHECMVKSQVMYVCTRKKHRVRRNTISAMQGNGPKLTLGSYLDFTNIYIKKKEEDHKTTRVGWH